MDFLVCWAIADYAQSGAVLLFDGDQHGKLCVHGNNNDSAWTTLYTRNDLYFRGDSIKRKAQGDFRTPDNL